MDYSILLIIICSSIFMYRVAEFDKKNGWIWGFGATSISAVYAQWISSAIGLLILTIITSLILMTIANSFKKPRS